MSLADHVLLEMLEDEHAEAVRRLAGLERAPFEGRVAVRAEYERTLRFARQRAKDLGRELRVARAEMDGA